MADEIGLNDNQIEKLETMSVEFQLQMVDQQAAIRKARINLRALKRNNADEKKVMAAIDEMARFKAEKQKLRYRHRLQTRDILTAEQLEKLDDVCKLRQHGQFNKRMGMQDRGRANRPRFRSSGF